MERGKAIGQGADTTGARWMILHEDGAGQQFILIELHARDQRAAVRGAMRVGHVPSVPRHH
jgi:hypothetical protein